jgi:hypothetical protein
MRPGGLHAVADDGGKPGVDYEAHKRSFQNTHDRCEAEGLQFVPLVAEACGGGWAPSAQRTWRELAKGIAARSGEPVSVEHGRLTQALAVALQRENARAVLRRLVQPGAAPGPLDDP